ncbi:MAG: hypothetical protein JNN17_12740 [Verrucomicrobiaceae bacterium]|nr:hypothetical protein [Verrucomicrobiaceae bacterium]
MAENSSEPPKSNNLEGCLAFAAGAILAPILLFSFATAIFGSSRHDSASGWGLAPILPYLWVVMWLPVYAISYALVCGVLQKCVQPKGSVSLPAALAATLIYILAALIARWLSKDGSFSFYG